MSEANLPTCSYAAEVAAYLDGELAAAVESSFDLHLTECPECLAQLNVQKRLLCALDFAFDDEKSFELPANFAKSIAVHAESDVSGLRSKAERQRALLITAGLFLTSALIGIVGKQSGLATFVREKLFAQIWAIVAILGNFCYDLCVGINVVLRMTERRFVFESPFLDFLLIVSLTVVFAILFRLLLRFHRLEHSSLNEQSQQFARAEK